MESLPQEVEKLKASLGPLPEAVVNPPLVVVSGLPGTGKSFFGRQLVKKLPAVRVESDVLRKLLFPTPTYSPEESAHLFRVLHLLIDDLLKRGIPVVFDATNLTEHHREHLYSIAERRGARLILVRVEAPAGLVQERLEHRRVGANSEDSSEADWRVYQRMKQSAERIRRSHFAVDTSRDIAPVVAKIVKEANRK